MDCNGKVLITGATGFIGSALAVRLANLGCEVHCPVRPKNTERINQLKKYCKVHIVDNYFQTLFEEAWAKASPDYVFHLASEGVLVKGRSEATIEQTNVDLMERVLQVAKGKNLRRLVYTGSCSEYAPQDFGQLISEEHPTEPQSLYGRAKAEATQRGVALAKKWSIPFVSLRLFGAYGPGEASERLIPHIITQLSRGESANLTSGDQMRDFLYIDDVISGLLLAAQIKQGLGGIYNLCSGTPRTVRSVGETVARIMKKDQGFLKWGAIPHRKDESQWIVGDNAKFKELTNWTPQVTLEVGIQKMIPFYT